ncbi:hypothetical protein LEMLEM_LOCUS23990 [Lemmus lemmus]
MVGFQFRNPILKGIRHRMIEEDNQQPPLALHICAWAHYLHTHTCAMCVFMCVWCVYYTREREEDKCDSLNQVLLFLMYGKGRKKRRRGEWDRQKSRRKVRQG